MAVNRTIPIATAEEIAVRAGQEAAFLRLPERGSVFADRETRLRELAAGHAMRDYLLFVAELTAAQHVVLQAYPPVQLPDAAALSHAAREGAAPLDAHRWRRDATWIATMRELLGRVAGRMPPGAARKAIDRVRAIEDDEIDRQADRLLHGVSVGLDLAAAPLIAAGLQAYWTHLVLATAERHGGGGIPLFPRTRDATRCPCCGSPPVASIVRIGAEHANQRLLHCSLCSAQWHMVRIKCASCEGTKGIEYQALAREGAPAPEQAPVQAETCGECGRYLKIVHMSRDAHVDPVADDLATVALDLLVSETGKERHGVNPMLLFGSPDGAEPRG